MRCPALALAIVSATVAVDAACIGDKCFISSMKLVQMSEGFSSNGNFRG